MKNISQQNLIWILENFEPEKLQLCDSVVNELGKSYDNAVLELR